MAHKFFKIFFLLFFLLTSLKAFSVQQTEEFWHVEETERVITVSAKCPDQRIRIFSLQDVPARFSKGTHEVILAERAGTDSIANGWSISLLIRSTDSSSTDLTFTDVAEFLRVSTSETLWVVDGMPIHSTYRLPIGWIIQAELRDHLGVRRGGRIVPSYW